MKLHKLLAFAVVTLFTDIDYALSFMTFHIIDVIMLFVVGGYFISFRGIEMRNNNISIGFWMFLFFLIANSILKVPLIFLFREVIQILEYIILMFLIAKETADSKKRNEFLNILFVGTGLIALFSLGYHFAEGKFAGFKDLDGPKHSFAFFAMLAIIRYLTKLKTMFWDWLCVIGGITMSLLSGERKGWLGLFFGLITFAWFQYRYSKNVRTGKAVGRLAVSLIALAFLAGVALTTISQLSYFDRQLSSLTDIATRVVSDDESDDYASSSNRERILMFEFGVKLFYKYPISGVGVNQFRQFVKDGTGGRLNHDAHNFYMKILIEEGLLGSIFFLIPVLMLFSRLFKLGRSAVPEVALNARIILALYVLGVVVNAFLASKSLTWVYYFLPCGLLLGLEKQFNLTNSQQLSR